MKKILNMSAVILLCGVMSACPFLSSGTTEGPSQASLAAFALAAVEQSNSTVPVQGTWSCTESSFGTVSTFRITQNTVTYVDTFTPEPGLSVNIRLVQSPFNRLYYQNPSTGSNPNKYFRFLWVFPSTASGGKTGLCYDGFCPAGCSDSLAGMMAITSPSNPLNLTSGCNGYAWNLCTRTN